MFISLKMNKMMKEYPIFKDMKDTYHRYKKICKKFLDKDDDVPASQVNRLYHEYVIISQKASETIDKDIVNDFIRTLCLGIN